MRQRQRLIGLGAVNTLLLVLTGWFAIASTFSLPGWAPSANREPLDVVGSPGVRTAAEIGTARSRPLFLRGRRPAPSDVPAKQKQLTDSEAKAALNAQALARNVLGEYLLTGVVLREQEPLVLVEPISGEKPSTLAQGATLEGWTLAEIHADRAVFTRDAQQRTLIFPEKPVAERAGAKNITTNPRSRTYRPRR